MDVKHKHVYGWLKIPGVKEPHHIDVGGIASTLQQIARILYESRATMRGEIEIVLSLSPRRPDSDMSPGEKAERDFASQHSDAIQPASSFDELLVGDERLLAYWRMGLSQANYDAAMKGGRVEVLTQYVADTYSNNVTVWSELIQMQANLALFGAAYKPDPQTYLFGRDSNGTT